MSTLVRARILFFFQTDLSSHQFFFHPKGTAHKQAELVGVIYRALSTSMNEFSWNKLFTTIRIRIGIGIKTIRDFATRQFHTLPGSLMPTNGPTRVTIVSRS